MLASNVNDARLYFLDCGKPVFSRLLRVRKRKLYYVPGLISLLGLPVLTRLYNVKRFVFIDDAYYILATPPPQPEPILDLKLDPLDDVVYGPEPATRNEPSQWEFFKFALAKWWQKAILIIKKSQIYVLGFLLLIIIPTIIRLHKKIFPNPKKSAIFIQTN
jgi:hypothetical protein